MAVSLSRRMEEITRISYDLATVVMGFGLFGANCAFNFERHQDVMAHGWRWSRLGYLDERKWAFALAVFLELTERGDEEVRRAT